MRIDYQGAFLNNNLQGKLHRVIANQHVTMITPQQTYLLPDELLGQEFNLVVDGYANDGQNEGYRVQLPSELQSHYLSHAIPHITLSVAEGAKPMNTARLQFEDLAAPFIVKARIGVFSSGRPVFKK